MAVRRTSALAVAAVLVLLALATAPAGAATFQHRDKTHDVGDTAHPPCPTCYPLTPAPTNRVDDVVGFGVNFRTSSLHLRVGTRSAPPNSPVPQMAWSVHTSSGLSLVVVVNVTKAGRPHVRVGGGGKKCDDTRVQFSERPRRWGVDLSRTCLREASWVQVGAISLGEDGGIYQDDALIGHPTCCAAPALSPKVMRG